MCPILKKLSNKLSSQAAIQVVNEIKDVARKKKDLRILEHLLLYSEHHFGSLVKGTIYHEKENGERLSDWTLDVGILHIINIGCAALHTQNKSFSDLIRDVKVRPHFETSIGILSAWLIHLEADSSGRNDSLNNDRINLLLSELYRLEQNMSALLTGNVEFDLAEEHCHRCLTYSRKYGIEGEKKTTMIFTSLRSFIDLRRRQGDFSQAVSLSEEAYNLVVEAYNPAHPEVQEAAASLINSLICKDDLEKAEGYAEITYGNLRDNKNEIDQESECVAKGAYNFADILHRLEKDLIKAEGLVRESIRIRSLIFGSGHSLEGIGCILLARILRLQQKLGDETKDQLERSLAVFMRNEGIDGANTACSNNNIGEFYYQLATVQTTLDGKRTQLLLAKQYFDEGIRIQTKLFDPTHPNTLAAKIFLSRVVKHLSQC
jgi:hypothetical protein